MLLLDTKWFGVVFVNVYAPTEDMDENEKDDFYSLALGEDGIPGVIYLKLWETACLTVCLD